MSLISTEKIKRGAAILVWFSFATLTSQMTKMVLNSAPYPAFLTESQFFFNVAFAVLAIYLRQKFGERLTGQSFQPFALHKSMFLKYLPMASFQFGGKFFSLSATVHCTVAAVSSMKSLTPMLTVMAYKVFYKVRFSLATYLSIIPLIIGVFIIVISQEKFTPIGADDDDTITHGDGGSQFNASFMLGLFLAFLSCCMFTAYSIFGKNAITSRRRADGSIVEAGSLALSSPDAKDLENSPTEIEYELESSDNEDASFLSHITEEPIHKTEDAATKDMDRPDRLVAVVYCSLFGLAYALPIFLFTEAVPLLTGSTKMDDGTEVRNYKLVPLGILTIGVVSHFFQTVLNLYVLSLLPTVTFSIANMVKKIVIITTSMIITGKGLTLFEITGLVFVLVGLFAYDRWGRKPVSD